MSSNKKFEVTELGIKNPAEIKKQSLQAGEVGGISSMAGISQKGCLRS